MIVCDKCGEKLENEYEVCTVELKNNWPFEWIIRGKNEYCSECYKKVAALIIRFNNESPTDLTE